MHASLNHWEGSIRATGGAIVPDKSHWFLIDFVWTHGNWRYARIADSPGQISVRGPDGQYELLQRLEHDAAEQTLDVRLALDGNNDTKFKYLLSVAKH